MREKIVFTVNIMFIIIKTHMLNIPAENIPKYYHHPL